MPYTSSVANAGVSSIAASPLAATNSAALASPLGSVLGGVDTSALAVNDPLCQLLGLSPASAGIAGIGQPVAGSADDMFAMMTSMLLQVMQAITGGGGPAAGTAFLSPAAVAVGAPVVDPSQFFGLINDNNGGDQATLQSFISQIASDPDGLALLQEAQQRGVSIEMGSPDSDPNVLGVTISNGNNDSRIIVRDLPTALETLVHELGHAVSTQDGNSREEEGAVEALAAKITRNINPQVAALSENNGLTLDQVAAQKSSLRAYQALAAQNNILGSLSSLGINVFG